MFRAVSAATVLSISTPEASGIGDMNEQFRLIGTPHGHSRAAIDSDSATAGSPRDATAQSRRAASSVALNNLRGVVILIVLAFHSFLAYLGSQGP